jgi:hypothetical protein
LNYNQVCFIEELELHMKRYAIRILMVVVLLSALLTIVYTVQDPILVQAQQPTGSIPTVTPLSTGPTGTVKVGYGESIYVRSGPGTLYNQVGVLLPGATVSVLGKTVSGDWLLISYPGVSGGQGWVWALYMDVTPGELPIMEIPPTPTPKITATIDPTMAAQFVITPEATRLPTFTQAAPLTIPTFSTGTIGNGHIPVGLIILILAGLGSLIGMISFIQSR